MILKYKWEDTLVKYGEYLTVRIHPDQKKKLIKFCNKKKMTASEIIREYLEGL